MGWLNSQRDISKFPESKISILKSILFETKEDIKSALNKRQLKKLKGKKNYISIWKELKTAIRMDLLQDVKELNKWKTRLLKNFITSYIKSFSIDENLEFINKLKYIADFFSLLWFPEEHPNFNKLDNLKSKIQNIENENISEIFHDIIINTLLLPETKNQDSFNEEMLNLINRYYDVTLNKAFDTYWYSPLTFAPINPSKILTGMDDKWVYSCYWNKELSWEFLTKFWFDFSIESVSNYNLQDRANFEFIFEKSTNWPGFSRDELNNSLKQYYHSLWNDTYLFWNDMEFYYYISVGEPYYKITPIVKTEDDNSEDVVIFKVDIWTQSKSTTMKSQDYLVKSILNLPIYSQTFLSKIYRDVEWNDLFKDLKKVQKETLKKEIIRLDDLVKIPEMSEDWEYIYSEKWLKVWSKKEWWEIIWEIDISSLKKKNLILTEDLQESIDAFIHNINNLDSYKKHWIWLPKWLLLYWKWGWWKTTISQNIVLSSKIKKKFFQLNIDQLLNEYIWKSEKYAKLFFEEMREEVQNWYTVFCLIDEVDWLMTAWTWTESISWTRSVILKELDWIASQNEWIIIFATTNHIEKLTAPFIRRFWLKLEVKVPDKATLTKLFDFYINKHFADFSTNLDVSKLVEKAMWKTSWFVEAWVINAIKYFIFKWFETLDNDVFMKTFEKTEFEISEEKWSKMWFMN